MKKFLNFETLVTPAILKILYPVLVIAFAIKYFWQMIAGLFAIAFGGLGSSFVALVSFIAMPFVLRILFELALVIFRMYEYTFKLANPDQELTGIINSTDALKKEVAANVPQQPNYQYPGYNYGQAPYQQQPQPGYDPNQYYQQGYNQNPYPSQGYAPQQPQQPTQGYAQPEAPAAPTTPTAPTNPNMPQQ